MRKSLPAILLVSLAFCLHGAADTITLKDGTVIEGTITQQDDSQVTVTVKDSETISSERILKQADISKIDKTPEDGLAFEQLKNLKPDPWKTLPAESYASTIANLRAFLEKYPQSAHKDAVQSILNAFLGEQAHQQAGDVKLFGHWISSQEAAARDSEVQAQALYFKMEASKDQGDVVGALNTFDKLEKNYPGSRIYPTAVPEAQTLIGTLAAQVNNAGPALQVKEDKFKRGVAITPEPEKSEMLAGRQSELAQYDSIVEGASKSQKWPPFIADSQKSLDTLTALITPERDRLLGLPVEKMNTSIAETDKAAEALLGGDLTAADTRLKNAITLWPVNEEAGIVTKALAAAKAALAAQPKKQPTPAGGISHIPVPKASASPAATVSTSASTATASPVSSVTPVRAAEDAKPGIVDFLFTIPGAITVVVCAIGLFVLTSFLQKSKRNRLEQEERGQDQ